MIQAYYLYTGADGDSHVQRGSIAEGALVGAESIHFKETPPHSSFDWHNDPTPQYVITLAGVLEFTTVGGETFRRHLVADDAAVARIDQDLGGRRVERRREEAVDERGENRNQQ